MKDEMKPLVTAFHTGITLFKSAVKIKALIVFSVYIFATSVHDCRGKNVHTGPVVRMSISVT